MKLEDYGAEYGSEWVCSKQFDHIVADPDHWTVGTLDTAVRVAKARAGLDPDAMHKPALFVEHLDTEWRDPFWDRQISRVVAQEGTKE
jgi:hypothetical protein